MRFKLDENLGPAVAALLRDEGHDVATVVGQGHRGITDPDLMSVCRSENRCLVTMDIGFSDPFDYPPSGHSGVVVFRLRKPLGRSAHLACARTFLDGLSSDSFPDSERRLISWIVEPGRIRSRRVEEPEEE